MLYFFWCSPLLAVSHTLVARTHRWRCDISIITITITFTTMRTPLSPGRSQSARKIVLISSGLVGVLDSAAVLRGPTTTAGLAVNFDFSRWVHSENNSVTRVRPWKGWVGSKKSTCNPYNVAEPQMNPISRHLDLLNRPSKADARKLWK